VFKPPPDFPEFHHHFASNHPKVAVMDREADVSMLHEIQVAIAVLAKAWEGAPAKLADHIPPVVSSIHAAVAGLLCMTSDLLGVKGDDVFAQLELQAVRSSEALGSSEDSDQPDSSEQTKPQGASKSTASINASGSDSTGTSTSRQSSPIHNEQQAHFSQKLRVMKLDERNSHGWCAGQGPSWGGRQPGAQTCALDCCITVACLLKVGRVQVDVELPTERSSIQASFLELTRLKWHRVKRAQSQSIKSKVHEMLLDRLNASVSGCRYSIRTFLPISLVFEILFTGIPQLSFRRYRSRTCRECHPPDGRSVESITLISLTGDPSSDLPAIMEMVLFGLRPGTCQACRQPSLTVKVASGDPPSRLCIAPPSGVTYPGIYSSAGITFVWYGDGSSNIKVRYSWIGGIYTKDHHFCVFWRDSDTSTQPDHPLLLKTYDGMIDDGAIYGGIVVTNPLDPVPDGWSPSILFLTLDSVKSALV
jgi:hypothetical protein